MASGEAVSVIVVNHNRATLLQRCLVSILEQTLSPAEILVIDNASTDGSRRLVSDITDPRVRLIAQGRNCGFAAANNVGIQVASSPLIALLNNDAQARPDWLQHLVQASRGKDEFGMFACKILQEGGQRIDKAGHLMFPDGQNRGRGSGRLDDGRYDREEECLFPDGCAALYRRQMLEEIGGFDEDFFAYADDADLGLRATWKGWKCLYVPTAVVYHSRSSTLGAYSVEKIYWVERNRLWLMIKNFPLPLLLMSPLFTTYRWLWNLLAALQGRGAAGRLKSQATLLGGAGTVVRALADGILGIPAMWKKRREIGRTRRVSGLHFVRLMWRYRISARELAYQDHE